LGIGTDLSAFADAAHFASWTALCPGHHESAGQRKIGKTRKGHHASRYRLA
jgi:transposase